MSYSLLKLSLKPLLVIHQLPLYLSGEELLGLCGSQSFIVLKNELHLLAHDLTYILVALHG
jgi:hypothetical protein